MRQTALFSQPAHHLVSLIVAVQMVAFFSLAPFAQAQAAGSFSGNQQMASGFSEEQFLDLTNKARTEQGLKPLQLNDQLIAAAADKASDMVTQGYWDHFRPSDHKAPWDFIHEEGYQYKVAGENLARGFKTSQGITNAWLASPLHRANLMSAKYSEVGFATIFTQDANGNPLLLTVQMFGSR